MKADDAKRLKELERENGRLKRIMADQLLHIEGLKEISRGLLSPARRRRGVLMLQDRLSRIDVVDQVSSRCAVRGAIERTAKYRG